MASVHRFSTETVEATRRLSFWNEGSSAIGGIEAELLAGQQFHGKVARRKLGPVITYALETGPHRAAWTRRLIGQSGERCFRLCFQQSGETHFLFGDEQKVLRAGQWVIHDSSRPYVTVHEGVSRKILLQVPASRLSQSEHETIRRLKEPFSTHGSVGQLLQECLQVSLRDLDEDSDRIDSELGDSLIDLFRMTFKDRLWESKSASMKELTRDRIRQFIRRNLADPNLSVDMIARSLKCSKRYVHKVFNEDETITEYIWAQRLERCRTDLLRDEIRVPTLTQLAFEHGFSSAAHFSRVFRARYGETPSTFRASRLM